MNSKRKKNEGITLIALVITIIGDAFKFDNQNSTYPILNWQ